MITVRKATMDDLNDIFKIKLDSKKDEMRLNKYLKPVDEVGSHYRSYLQKDLESSYRVVFIALDGDKIIGMIIGRVYRSLKTLGYERRASMGNLFVDDNYRRKGIAKKLMLAFDKWAKERKVKTITLNIYSGHEFLKEMYEKDGFKEFCMTMHKEIQ